MSNLQALEKFKKNFGGQKLGLCFSRRNNKRIFDEFIETLYDYNYVLNDDYRVDASEEELEEDAAWYTLNAIINAGEYASKLIEEMPWLKR